MSEKFACTWFIADSLDFIISEVEKQKKWWVYTFKIFY